MIYAEIDSTGLVLNTAVADPDYVFPEGTWVPCPEWVGIGMNINDPMPPEPIQPQVEGAQTL